MNRPLYATSAAAKGHEFMGVMRFLVESPTRITSDVLSRASFCGMDLVPWHTRIRLSGNELFVEREVSDSGTLRIPWRLPERGEWMLATATLMERPATYQLEIELARGKINQVRNQLADWQLAGLTPPASVTQLLHEAQRDLAQAVTHSHHRAEAARNAEKAIGLAIDAAQELAHAYAEQILVPRNRQASRPDLLLAIRLGGSVPDAATTSQILNAFNGAQVSFSWRDIEPEEGRYDWSLPDRQVEWCRKHGLPIAGGPLVQFDRLGIPDWLSLWTGDLENLARLVGNFVRTTVHRYRGKIKLWQSAAQAHADDVLGLSEEDTLRLVGHTIEQTRQVDPQTRVLISFDQPWAEYMAHREMELSPWHFADLLIRADIGLGGIGLEINFGYHPGGSSTRDLLDVGRLVDQWSLLGVPILVTLAVPSDQSTDPLATMPARVLEQAVPGGWTMDSQEKWTAGLVELLMAKPAVRGIIWSQMNDAEPHEYPHGGLWDNASQPKPALAALAALRKAHLT